MSEHIELYANNLPNAKWYGYPGSIIIGSVIFIGYHIFRTIIDSVEFSKKFVRNYLKSKKFQHGIVLNERENVKKLGLIDLVQ